MDGAGVILIPSRIEEAAGRDAPADMHFRRNMWMVLFGAIHAHLLLWPADILYKKLQPMRIRAEEPLPAPAVL